MMNNEKHEIEEILFHAPARNSISECLAVGCDKDVCEKAWGRHLEECRKRGIGVIPLLSGDL